MGATAYRGTATCTDTPAERRCLGSILIAPEHPDTLRTLDTMQADHFFDDKHRQIASRILHLHRRGVPPDALTVRHDLAQLGLLASDGDLAHFLEILQSTATAFSVIHWADLVRKAAEKRDFILALQDGIARISNGDDPATVRADVDAELDLRSAGAESPFNRITAEELEATEYSIEWDATGLLVRGQPCGLCGPKKSLKTNTMLDAAISLATGGHVLGYYPVPEKRHVAVMSGESGMATIRETCLRISKAAGVRLGATGIIFSDTLPKFHDAKQLGHFRRFLKADGIQVVFVDPMYLCVPETINAASSIEMGTMLRSVAEVCREQNCTLVMCHHTKKNSGLEGKPLELEDISWAGFSEFFRQWWLVNRRERYVVGTGEHRLWWNVGGSVGHSSLLGLDISEGVYDGPESRIWGATVRKSGDVVEDAQQRAEAAKDQRAEDKRQRQVDRDKRAVVDAMRLYGDAAETVTRIRGDAKIPTARARCALAELVEDGQAAECEVSKPNRKAPYKGYRLVYGED